MKDQGTSIELKPLKKVTGRITQKRKILALLNVRGSMTAPELGKLLKISLPTSIVLLNELIASEHIVISGIGESSGGRKPNLYSLRSDYYVIVCDILRFSAKIAIVDTGFHFATQTIHVDTHMDDPQLVEKLYTHSVQLCASHSISYDSILGIGVDMPGLISSKQGLNYTIKDKKRQNVGRDMRNKFNKLVYVDNDARMHANGEFYFGEAKGCKDAIVIHWSWGLGLGIHMGGQLYSGKNGFAGEFSHIPIVENGDLCICGKRGCLETIASSNTIMKLVREGIEKQAVSSLLIQYGDRPDEITPEMVIHAAREGDQFCINILNEVGKAMGIGLSFLIQLLNPEIIVLSGPISTANQYVLSPIQQSLNRLCLEKISGNTLIKVSNLGDHTAILGCAMMVFQKAFADMQLD